MLIGKHEWFKRKTNGDFGILGIPWQGTVYLLLTILLPLTAGIIIPEERIAHIIATVLLLFLLINLISASWKFQDEIEQTREAVPYRNAFYGVFIALIMIQTLLFNYNLNQADISNLIKLAIFTGILIGIITKHKLDNENEMKILRTKV